jgi:FkbM family methyltransferase
MEIRMTEEKKVAYSKSRKNTVLFDHATREIYSLDDDVDIGFLEYEMVNRSRVRRPSSKISERIFFKYVIDKEDAIVLEVGGNNGRHTRRFLAETTATIHTFEPNVYAIKYFNDIVEEERLWLNMYGLSSEQRLLTFNILTQLGDKKLDPVNGASSFNRLKENAAYRTVTACCISGTQYLEMAGIAGKPYCLWVDVEGHATEVISGFGDALQYAKIVICELENTNMYNSGANADDIIRMLLANGHKIIFRDFQNYGQFNIVSINETVLMECATLIEPAGQFIADISKFANSHLKDEL